MLDSKRWSSVWPVCLILAATLVISACSSDDDTPPPSSTATSTAAANTATRTATSTAAATRTSTAVATATTTSAPTLTSTAVPTPTATTAATETPTSTPENTATATVKPILLGASKSSAVAISPDESFVLVVNPDNDSVTVLDTASNTVRGHVDVGDEPVAVVVHPDGRHAYVANRTSGTVTEIIGLETNEPTAARTVAVGSEPTSLALSPTGAKLFVAAWAEGGIAVVNTETFGADLPVGLRNPRAVAVTNDGDSDDDDESLIVTEFYGAPNPDTTGCASGSAEACDTGRIGRVRRFSVGTRQEGASTELAPLDSGIVPTGAASTAMTSPNQLYAAALRGDTLYVTSVSASPQPPLVFNGNVYPVIYVADLTSNTEDHSNVGTVNLAKLANDVIPDEPGTDRFFLQEIVDLAFVPGSDIAYVVSRAADTVQQVIFDPATGTRLGLPQINVGATGCQNPIGIAIAGTLNRAYVNCWLTRRIAVINLADQSTTTVQSAELPLPDSPEDEVRLGKRFYFTGRGRWSEEGEGYSSCASCHPDGLSDNITWSFAAGPRQTTSMDGSFSHGPGTQKRRILNWTGIFDELHDFERNTRGVSGGLGAVTTSPSLMCGILAEEVQVSIPGDGLGTPVKEIQDTTEGICTHDWDKIDSFVKTIRPPRARQVFNADAVAAGEAQFIEGACATCHGGSGWTVSRRFWTPSSANNTALMSAAFTPAGDPTLALQSVQIGPQPAEADPTAVVVPPNEVACALRRVGTFGVPGDTTATDLLERKVNAQRAQGAGGFNVPSLYGLAAGAPYLHHGQAPTLQALFSDPRWADHLRAAAPEFSPSEEDIDNLVAYLFSIDADKPEQSSATTPRDVCPPVFPDAVTRTLELSGAQESPAQETTATGAASVSLSGDDRTIQVELSTTGIATADILAAHIHVGPPGENGPVALFIAERAFTSPLRVTLGAENFISSPSAATYADLVTALRMGNAYINVHSAQHEGGEVRGQIPAF